MPLRQKIWAIAISITIFIVIIELVRRRKLREEYSFLWLLTGGLLFVVAVWYDLLKLITRVIGAGFTSSTLFFFGIIFLMLMNLHFSIKISELSDRVKDLAKELTLMKAEGEE